MDEQEEYEYERNNERKFIVSIIIIIILLLLLFLFGTSFGYIEHRDLHISTGNVDIFDILIENNCQCPPNEPCNNQPSSCSPNRNPGQGGSSSTSNNQVGSGNEQEPEEEPKEGVEVFDDDTYYGVDTKLNIFKNTYYEVVENKIAPLSENSYQFVIRNNNNFNITYSIKAIETNDFNIKMRYRLRQSDKFLIGSADEWVTADEIEQFNRTLPSKEYDVYILDWKWFEGENDTEVGMDIDAYYKLNMEIKATEY